MRCTKASWKLSGFPDNVTTTEEKLNYIAEIHEHEGIELDIDKVAKNPGRCQMCKILLNSFWQELFISCNILCNDDFVSGASLVGAKISRKCNLLVGIWNGSTNWYFLTIDTA